MIDWKLRAQVLADPDHSDAIKRAMMRFWLAADNYEKSLHNKESPIKMTAEYKV